MALWCLNYLSSLPFGLATAETEVGNTFKKGYYVFLGYAASYWLDHFLAGMDQTLQCNASSEIYQRVDSQMRAFLRNAQVLDQENLDLLAQDHSRLHHIVCKLPREATARNKWVQLEARISRIMKVMETMAQEPQGDLEYASNTSVLAIYGTLRYRCPKLGCVYFQEGFTSSSDRDAHLDYHQRPFTCIVPHCPYQNWGFPDRKGLDRHTSRSHKNEDEGIHFLFPKPTNGSEIDIKEAIIRGDTEAVQALNIRGRSRNGLVDLSIQHGHLDICKYLIHIGAPFSPHGVLEAVKSNDLELMHIFLSANMTGEVDLNAKDNHGRTPLFLAIRKQNLVIVRMLLVTGKVNLDAKDNRGKRPLSLAIRLQNLDIVKLLLETGKVDVNAQCQSGQTPLGAAVASNSCSLASKLLSIRELDPNRKTMNKDTPLLIAVREGMIDMVKIFLETARVDLEARASDGMTPLMIASKNGNIRLVGMLLNTDKVNVNAWNGYDSPLSLAVLLDHLEVIKILLRQPDIRLDIGHRAGNITALGLAVAAQRYDIVDIFLKSGRVEVNMVSSPGHQTPLIRAVTASQRGTVRMLVEMGKVNLNAIDANGQTASDYAATSGKHDVIDLLQKAGAERTHIELLY